MNSFIKDPEATLDYVVDWTEFLNGSAISSSSWVVPAGITLDSDTNDGLKAVAYISGGSAGQAYAITNRITYVVDGVTLTDDRTITIIVQNK